MKYAEVKDLFGNTEEIPDSDYVETLLGKVIMAWNLPEVEGGEVLPIPATDVQSIHKLPNIIITHLVEQITGTNLRTQTEDLEVTS